MEGSTVARRIGVLSHQLSTAPLTAIPTAAFQAPSRNAYDVIIIGGGIHGTATADALSQKGKKVLLLEQFNVNHEEGSSHGDGRIIRFSYPETIYIQMAKLAYPLWQDIEMRHGSKVTHTTGGITFAPANDPDLLMMIDNFTQQGVPFEVLTPEETTKTQLQSKFPMYRIPAGHTVVYQRDAGVAFASKAVKALWELAARQGATLLANEKAVTLNVVNDRQVVVTTKSGKRFTGSKLVVTAGAWAKDLLLQLHLDLPLIVTQEQVFYWKEKEANSRRHHMHNMPIFISHGELQFYGLPQIDIPGVKVGWHYSGHEIDVANKTTPPDKDIAREKEVSKFVSKILPDLVHDAPTHKLYCLYTTTPDAHFIIDYHPKYKNVIIGSPCSGHGFKFGPAIGTLLASMAVGEIPSIPLDQFKISRFSGPITRRTGV